MADKIERVVQFNVITDIQDAVTKTKQLQEFLNKLGVPEKLQSSFSKAFTKIEDAGAKAGAALARGLKDNKDINAFNTASKQIGDTWTHLTELLNKIPKDKLKDFFSASVKQQIDDINNSIKQTQTEIGAIAAKSIKAKNTKYQRAKAAVTTKLPGTVSAFESAMGSGDFAAAQAAITATSKLNKAGGFNAGQMRDLAAAMEYALKKAQNLAEVKQRLGIVDGQNAEIAKLYAQALAEGNAYIDAQTGELKQGAQALDNMTQEQLGAAKAQNEMNQEMENFKNKITYFFGAANAINLLKRAARSAFATIKDLDKVMTEAAVVTNFSVGDMWSQLPEYTRRANELGVSVHDAYESATLFYQQGLKTNEVMAVSNETLKMARIAGLGAEDATKRMTNALRGFNMEINEASAGRINDVYSALAAKAAANVDEISTAMTKVASLAKSAGMEFETTSAFLTQIIETTQESPETAGTALKTIVSRFGEVKKLASEGGLTGTDEEGEVINLNKISTALKEVAGIDMSSFFAGTEGLDSILMKLSEKWDTLSTVQQRYIATQAAGSRQQSRFIALMQDYARTQELVSIAENSAGASNEQFGKTLDSLDSKLNRLKNAYDTFTMGLMESDLVKGVVDILTGIINAINNITKGLNGWAGILPKILMLWSGFKVAKTLFNGLFNSIATQFKAGGEKAAGAFRQGFEQGIKKQQGGKGWAGLKGGLLGSLGLSKQKLQHQTFSQDQGLDVLYGQNGQGGLLGQESQLDPSKITNALASANGSVEVFRDNLIAAGASVEDVDKALNQFIPATEGVSVNLQQMGMAASTTGMALTMLSAAIDPEQQTAFGKAVSGAGTALMVMGSILPMVGTALSAFGVSLAAAFWPILAIVAGVALLTAGIVAFVDSLQADTRAVKDAQKAHEEAQKAYEEEKKKLDSLNSSLISLKTAYDELDSGKLVEGTEEYNNALQKINETVTDLLVKIPELRKAFTYENGVWRLTNETKYQEIMDAQRDQVIKKAVTTYDSAVNESQSWGNIIKDEKRVEGRLTLKEFTEAMEGGANIEAAFTKLGKDLSDENRLKIANALKGEDYKAITQAFWEAGVDIDEGTQNEELAGQALQALLRGEDYTTTKVATEEYRQAILSAYGGDIQKGFADLEFERGEQAEQIFKGLATKPEYKEGLAKFASGELTQEQYAQFEKQIKDGFGDLGTEWLLFFEKHRPEVKDLTKSQSAGYLSQSKEIQAEVDKLSADNRAIAADALNGINIGEDGMAAVQAFINKIEQSGKSTEAFNKTIDQLEKAAAKVGRKMSETDEQWKGFLDTQTKLSLGQELTTEEFENLKKSMPDVFRKFEGGFVETANGVQIWDQALNQALINTILGYNEGLTEQQQRMRDAHQALDLIANTDTQLLIQRALDVGIAYSEVAKLQKKYGDGTEQLGEALKNLITATENGAKGLETFIHEIDRLYNLDQIQVTLQRERSKYQREYNALLADGTLDIQKVTTARELEISALQLQRQNLEKELEVAKEELANIGSKHWIDENGVDHTYAEQQKYFTVDELGTIQMTDAYTKLTDKDDSEAADKYREELQKAVDLVRKKEDEIYENIDDLKALQDERLEDIITLEDRLGNMLEKEWEQRIEDQETLNDAIQESNQRIVDELRKSIDLEREIRENTKKEEEIAELENRLAYLQRDTTGANDLEIMKTQKELDAKRESYIDGIVDSALKEIETQNEEVMKVQTDQLAYLKSSYELWQNDGSRAKEITELKNKLLEGDNSVINRLKKVDQFFGMTDAAQSKWSGELWTQIEKGLSADVIKGTGVKDLAKNKTLSDLQTKLNETADKINDIPSQVATKLKDSDDEAKRKANAIIDAEKEKLISDILNYESELGYVKKGTKFFQDRQNQLRNYDLSELTQISNATWKATQNIGENSSQQENESYRDAKINLLSGFEYENESQFINAFRSGHDFSDILPILSKEDPEKYFRILTNKNLTAKERSKLLTSNFNQEEYENRILYFKKIDELNKEEGLTDIGFYRLLFNEEPWNQAKLSVGKIELSNRLQEGLTDKEKETLKARINKSKKDGFSDSNLGGYLKQILSSRYFEFASGGLADFTGPAWLDGTKSHPEIVLNPSDSQNFIALRDILRNFDPTQQNSLTGDTYFDIKIDADIGSDYDVDQLAARIKQQIYQDGQYRNARVISYLR